MTIAKSLALFDRSLNADAIKDKMDEIGDALRDQAWAPITI